MRRFQRGASRCRETGAGRLGPNHRHRGRNDARGQSWGQVRMERAVPSANVTAPDAGRFRPGTSHRDHGRNASSGPALGRAARPAPTFCSRGEKVNGGSWRVLPFWGDQSICSHEKGRRTIGPPPRCRVLNIEGFLVCGAPGFSVPTSSVSSPSASAARPPHAWRLARPA